MKKSFYPIFKTAACSLTFFEVPDFGLGPDEIFFLSKYPLIRIRKKIGFILILLSGLDIH